MTTPGKPHAVVRRVRRWVWSVTIHDGMINYGPGGYSWTYYGTKRRAMRKANRQLGRYFRVLRQPEETIIR